MAKFDFKRWGRSIAGRPDELMFTVVAGAAINTNIAVSGATANGQTATITLRDALVAVLEFQDTAGATQGILADRVNEASITSAGNIQLTTSNTTGHGLLVIWLKRRG